MAAPVNYAEQYFRALCQDFPYVLNFGELFNSPNNSEYKPVDAKTIKIPKITTTGRKDGNRDTIGGFSRNHENDWITLTLTNHREWETMIHPMDVVQSNMVMTIQNATKVFNEQQKFPEMDAYLVSKLFSNWTGMGQQADTTELTVDNVLAKFDALMEAMDEARVPQTGRILYVTPAVNTLIKNAKDIQRTIDVAGTSSKQITRTVSRIDEVSIRKVPSDLMRTVYDFTQGWKPGVGAKQINFMLIHPIAVLTPVIYSFASIDNPRALTKGKALYYEEAFEDVFVLEPKKKGIAFNIAEITVPQPTEPDKPVQPEPEPQP